MKTTQIELLYSVSHPGRGDGRHVSGEAYRALSDEQQGAIDEYLDQEVSPPMADYSFFPISAEANAQIDAWLAADH